MSQPLRTAITAVVTATLAFSLSGCIPTARVSSPPSEPRGGESTSSSDPTFAEQPSPGPSENLDNVAFGDAVTYADGVSISVSAPAEFVPSEYAAGADQGANVVFQLTITNGSDENLNPVTYSRVASGGIEASAIFDSGNSMGDIGLGPTTVILPGGTITWLEAYSLTDPSSIVFQISPSFDYQDAVFTNQQ